MIGTLLSERFRLEERIGTGGMSTVYRAFDETLERQVAIKMLHADMSQDEASLERFRREARSAARLSHPHVVTVIDAGEDDGRPFIVFEYVEGETLKERIRRLGRLPIAEALAYAIEIGRALMAAHAERIVHRDIKPQNVLIDYEGRGKVTDFGIARSLELEMGLTADGRVLGTTDYVAPEQAVGDGATEQSDIYSLGICLWEMLTGDVPFKAESQVGVAMKHVRDPLPDVQHLRPEASALVASIVDRATRKELGNRYATAEEMVHDLEQALAIEAARGGQLTGEATTVLRALPGDTASWVPLRIRSPRRLLAIGALLAAATAAVLAVLALNTEPGQTGSAAPRQTKTSFAVRLSGVEDFDPPPGDGREGSGSVREAIDGNPSTSWRSEHYRAPLDRLGKKGIGIYVLARNPVAARELHLITSTPGFEATVYGSSGPLPESIDGWTQLAGAPRRVKVKDGFTLDTAGKPFKRYLVWISKLPNGGRAEIQELTLQAQKR